MIIEHINPSAVHRSGNRKVYLINGAGTVATIFQKTNAYYSALLMEHLSSSSMGLSVGMAEPAGGRQLPSRWTHSAACQALHRSLRLQRWLKHDLTLEDLTSRSGERRQNNKVRSMMEDYINIQRQSDRVTWEGTGWAGIFTAGAGLGWIHHRDSWSCCSIVTVWPAPSPEQTSRQDVRSTWQGP